jgi:Domain of unknown function (DUF4192)
MDGADDDFDPRPTVRAAGPEDIVATVWFRLGYRPRESLVLVGLHGPRHQAGVILRDDLPPPGPGARLRRLVADSLHDLVTAGADALVALVVREGVLVGPRPAIVEILERTAARARIDLVDVIGVTADAYGSLLCPDPLCCPAGGRPIAEVMASRGAAAHLALGDTVLAEETDLIADVLAPSTDPTAPVPSDEAAPTSPGASTASTAPTGSTAPAAPARLSRAHREVWWERWLRACAEAPGREPLPVHRVLGLSGALHDPLLRDAVLTHVLGAPPEQVRPHLHGAAPDATDTPDGPTAPATPGRATPVAEPDLARLLSRRPDPGPVGTATAVLAAAARAAPAGEQAPALAVLAMLAWYQGQAGRARLLVRRAGQDSGAVSLTRLVRDLLTHRLPPPWHRNRNPSKAGESDAAESRI